MLKSETAAGTEALMQRGWLQQTPVDFAEAVLANCRWKTIATGQTIQHAGDPTHGLIGVARGTVSITTSLGSPDVPMAHIGHPGTWYGIVPIFTNKALPTGVVARSDVLIATITQPQLEALLANRPVWWRYVGMLGVVYGNTAANLAADGMIRDSRRRCAAALLRLADCRFVESADGQQVEAPLSQDELAAISNLSRTSVSTILRELEDRGLITLGYRTVNIHQPDRLRAVVDDV